MTDRHALQQLFVGARELWAALVVARARGTPVDPGDTIGALEARYRAARLEVGRRLADSRAGASAPNGGADPWTDYACAVLDELDAWEPPPDGTALAACSDQGEAARETSDVADLRRGTLAAYGAAAAGVTLPGGEVVDRLTAIDRLATTSDPGLRRSIFLALEPVWRAVDGDGGSDSPYGRLIASSATRWARAGSPIDAAASALGIEPASLEPMLWSVLAAWRRAVGDRLIEPWDFHHATGAADRLVSARIPADRLLPVATAHLASLGASARELGVEFDVFPRPGRPDIPVAFTLSIAVSRLVGEAWRPARPRVFATYGSGGLGNLTELLHECGHALHDAAIRTEPHTFELWPADGGLVEGIADVVGWDAHEPDVQARHLGAAAPLGAALLARYGLVVLDVCWTLFEIELHRRPDRLPNEVWSEITAAGLGIAPHPEWSWWATRGQLIDAPGYMANYALAALVAAAVRARIRAVRGDWTASGDPGWYPFLAERLLRFGGTRRAGELLTEFLGAPLDAAPLLADLGRM